MAVDRLITVLEAQDKFTPVARRVEQSASSLAQKLQLLQNSNQISLPGGLASTGGSPLDLISALATRFNPVGLILTALTATLFAGVTAGVAYAGVLGMVAQRAIAAASEMQALQATLEAVTGSAERASEKMQFLRRFARESVFEFQDLARAGTLLESFGLRMERVLPIIARLGAVFGASSELIEQLASAFGRIGAGQFGEAMEILRRFGIGADALRARGVEFTGGGQIVSRAETVLRAVEAIVLERFGSVTERMSKTLVVQLSNLRDSLFQMFEVIGRAMLPGVQIFTHELQRVLSALRESDALNNIALAFGRASVALGTTLANLLPKAIAWMAALIESGPQLFNALWDSARQFISNALQSLELFMNTMSKVFIQLHNVIADLINSVRRALGVFGGALQPMQRLSFTPVAFGGLSVMLGPAWQHLSTRASEIEAQIRAGLRLTGESDTVPVGEQAGGFWSRQQTLTEEIARNTRETKNLMQEQIQFQRIILGGGERASLGLTPVERSRLMRSDIQRGAESFVEQIVERMLRLRVVR